jgi:hypothetical protein
MNNTNAQKCKSPIFNQENRSKFITRVNLNKLARLAAIILFLLLTTVSSFDRVQAASLTYYLQDVNFFGEYIFPGGIEVFFGGGGVTGSFVFDSDTGLFSNVNVVATSYTVSTGVETYSDTFSVAEFAQSSLPNTIIFATDYSSSSFVMGLAGELPTVSGDSVGICGQITPSGALRNCPYGFDSGYARSGGESRYVQVNPYQPLLTVGPFAEVPEPSTVVGLLAFVTLGAFLQRNRRRSNCK